MGNLKQICKVFGGLIKSHPKSAAILGSAGFLYGGATINDTNVFDFGIKSAKKALRFNDDETVLNQVGRTVTDNFTTEGTYDSTKKGVTDFVSGIFGGGGSGEGSEAGQGGGLMSGLFNSIGNGIKNLMGGLMGGVTNMLSGKLPMLLMLPLAWLAFSRFGWLGKIGGLLLGVFAASSLLHGGQQQTDSRQLASRVADGTAQQRFDEKRSEQAKQDTEEQYTVHMH